LILSFEGVTDATRECFKEFVERHLERWAVPGSLGKSQAVVCDHCGSHLFDALVRKKMLLGEKFIHCDSCGSRLSLPDPDRSITSGIGIERGASTLQSKIDRQSFDVFICYNHDDKDATIAIVEELKDSGILPWMDEWSLRPGLSWEDAVQEVIGRVKSAAIFYGQKGVSTAQQVEIKALVDQHIRRKCPVIPVILPNCTEDPTLPPFIGSHSWVDFRDLRTNPYKKLAFGITGIK
jgi:hypothetical protein